MLLTIETTSYNERRMGRPWIAKVDFRESSKGDFIWGEWVGDHRNGAEGILTLNVDPGDIVAQGQKDNRKPSNSAPDFYVVSESGELESIGGRGAAYKHFLAKSEKPRREQLIEEREQLVKRIVEITAELREENNS